LSLWALQEKEARLKMQSVESRKKLLDDIAQEECKKVSINQPLHFLPAHKQQI
jgi:hypothetical protein